jgi:molybdopterin-containing oxidoreductase family membrane subunit
LESVHHIAPLLALAGLTFSMLHQSSLGATYGVLKARPFWYKPSLSVLFMASAIVGGLALTVLVSRIAARLSARANVRDELLDGVSKFVGWALLIYLYLRFWDLLGVKYTYLPGRTEAFNLTTSGPLAINFWGGEIIFGILVPVVILMSGRLRRHERLQVLALALIVGGVIAYRWNTNMAGQLVVLADLARGATTSYTSYVPSLVEIAAGAGVIAYGALAITLGIRYLHVVDHSGGEEVHSPGIGDLRAEPALAGD